FSIAVIWVALSPSSLPAAVVRVIPSLSADSLAPLAIATKNGFVEVLVINVTPIGPAAEPPAAWLAVEELVPVELAGELPEQAANNMAAVARVDTAPRRLPVVEWVTGA